MRADPWYLLTNLENKEEVIKIGYHLVTLNLLQVKARFPGDELFCRSVWTAPGYEANEDEF